MYGEWQNISERKHFQADRFHLRMERRGSVSVDCFEVNCHTKKKKTSCNQGLLSVFKTLNGIVRSHLARSNRVNYRPDFRLGGETEKYGKHRVVDKITQNPEAKLRSLFLRKQGNNRTSDP